MPNERLKQEMEMLPGGTRVFTCPVHRVGTDALLLCEFCEPKRGFSLVDLGTGCGILALGLLDKGLVEFALAIEMDKTGAALVEKAAAENKLPNLEVVCGDLREHRPQRQFDMVVANPPYYNTGPLPPKQGRAAARHEVTATLADFCEAAARMLKDKGRFCLCWPPERLTTLLETLSAHRLEAKRLQFVRKAAEAPPWLALVEARKNGGKGLLVMPERILPPGQPVQY